MAGPNRLTTANHIQVPYRLIGRRLNSKAKQTSEQILVDFAYRRKGTRPASDKVSERDREVGWGGTETDRQKDN